MEAVMTAGASGMFARATSTPFRYTTAPSSYSKVNMSCPVVSADFVSVKVFRKYAVTRLVTGNRVVLKGRPATTP